MYFPQNESVNIEANVLCKRKLLLMLDEIIEDREYKKERENIDIRMAELEDCIDVAKYDTESSKNFERMCLFISQELHKDAKGMTTMEYNTAVKMILDRQKELEKTMRKK